MSLRPYDYDPLELQRMEEELALMIFDTVRVDGKPLWFVEFPDNSWLMEDKVHTTREPHFALPFTDKVMCELFIKHYKLEGCTATEHLFVAQPSNETKLR